MKKSLFILAAASLILAGCKINDDYNLEKIDKEVTVLPGAETAIDVEPTRVDAGGFIPVGLSEADEDGNLEYAVNGSVTKVVPEGQDVIFESTEEETIKLTIDVPEIIRDQPGLRLSDPRIEFNVNQPGYSSFSANIKANGKTVPVSGEPIDAEGNVVLGEEVRTLFEGSIPAEVEISDIHLQAAAPASVAAAPSMKTQIAGIAVSVVAKSVLPLSFEGGTVLTFHYAFKDLGISLSELDKYDISTGSVEIKAKVTSALPFSFELNSDDDSPVILHMTKINAGTVEDPVDTDVVIYAELKKFEDLEKASLTVVISVPDGITATINSNQYFVIDLESFKVVEGITIG